MTTAKRRPARRRPRAAPPKPRGAERKSEATRRTLLASALRLFQHRGVEATTMRDIARAAGLSLGAAYYYFPSKDALVFAYYEANQDEVEALVADAAGDARARVGAVLHASLRSVQPYRRMLAAIIGRLVDPADPLSALSAQQRDGRTRAIAMMTRALEPSGLSGQALALASHALWLGKMAALLLYVHDPTPDQARTHQLVDDVLDLVVPMLPLLGSPIGRVVLDRVAAALSRAGVTDMIPPMGRTGE